MMTTASIDLDVKLPVGAPALNGPVDPLADDAVESFSQAMEQPQPNVDTGSAAFREAVQAFADAFTGEELSQTKTPVATNGAQEEPDKTVADAAVESLSPATNGAQEEPVASVETVPLKAMPRDDEDAGDAADRMVAAGMVSQQVPIVPVRTESPEGTAAAGVVAADGVEAVERIAKSAAASDVMLQVAEEIADSILVSPGLLRGEGEIRIQLKPDVLGGSEVRIGVEGRQLGVELLPVSMDVAAFVERNLPQLQQLLATRVSAFTVGVSMRRNRVGRA